MIHIIHDELLALQENRKPVRSLWRSSQSRQVVFSLNGVATSEAIKGTNLVYDHIDAILAHPTKPSNASIDAILSWDQTLSLDLAAFLNGHWYATTLNFTNFYLKTTSPEEVNKIIERGLADLFTLLSTAKL